MARNNKPKVRVQPEPLSPEDIKCCACGEVGGKKMVYGIDINPHWAGKPYESFPFFLCNCGAYVGGHRGDARMLETACAMLWAITATTICKSRADRVMYFVELLTIALLLDFLFGGKYAWL